jgi:signal transduction histidine kinase
LSSSHLSRKFLQPIYLLKENAKLIEAGKYKRLIEVNTNTFELHDLSLSVKNLAEKLDYQEGLRKRMTTDIAHELRTPLATIQSHIEAFIDGIWKPDNEKLSVIHDEIIRLAKLIKNLSDLAVVENDDIKLHKEELNLSKLLINITENFEPLFNTKNIQLNMDIQDDVEFTGDVDKLNQVFVNILSNAYKYANENGQVNVKLSKSKDKLSITVEDNGIGIPKEDIKNVFERFYRSDISRSRGTGGTGIGLTISKAIVEAHDGRIWIESEVGRGTKVIIEFEK